MNRLLEQALEKPIEFPPISQTIFPGDRVAIVPDAFVAKQPMLLAELVLKILETGASPCK